MERFENQQNKYAELKAVFYELLARPDADELYSRMAEFAKKLRAKYEDYEDYGLYHILGGSTPEDLTLPKWDFEGDDSIEFFLRRLQQDVG